MGKRATRVSKPEPPPVAAVSPAPIVKQKPAAQQVVEWMVKGHQEADIAEAVAAMFPGANAKKLIELAVDHFVAAAHCQRDVILGWAMEAYRELYRSLLNIGDYPGAMKAVGSLVKLSECLKEES